MTRAACRRELAWYTSVTPQSMTVSPETSGRVPVSHSPFTWVPFWLSRSQICASPAVRMIRAWLRDTAASWSWSTAVSPRPTTTCPVLGSGNTHDESRSKTRMYGESTAGSAAADGEAAGIVAWFRSRCRGSSKSSPATQGSRMCGVAPRCFCADSGKEYATDGIPTRRPQRRGLTPRSISAKIWSATRSRSMRRGEVGEDRLVTRSLPKSEGSEGEHVEIRTFPRLFRRHHDDPHLASRTLRRDALEERRSADRR